MPWVRPQTLAMMEDSAVTYVAQVPGRHSMRMATSGVAVLAEFLDKLEGVGRLDRTMGSIKQRARGVTAGEVLVGLVTDPKCRSGSGVGRAHRCRTRARLAGRRHNCLSGGFSGVSFLAGSQRWEMTASGSLLK